MNANQDAAIGAIRSKGYAAVATITPRYEYDRTLIWEKVKGGYVVYDRDYITGTNAILREHRTQKVATKAERDATMQKWTKEIVAMVAKRDAAAAANLQEPFAEPPPKVETQGVAGKQDRIDMEKARLAVLHKKWPHTMQAMEKKADPKAIERAYILDTAALTGQVVSPHGAGATSPEMAKEIAKALCNFSRQTKRGDTTITDYAIAFNWPSLVYLSAREFADELNRILDGTGITVTPGQAKQRRLSWDLTPRRGTGPARNS
jgi:hypothetical protein